MERKEFRKANGDVFLIAERMPDNAYIHARWIGIQSIETVMQGGNYYATMLQTQPCARLLNDHKELIGPWDVANQWIVNEWTPKVLGLGLQYMAQVLAPGIYGKMSFHQLHQQIENMFEIRMFEDPELAKKWLQEVDTFSVK